MTDAKKPAELPKYPKDFTFKTSKGSFEIKMTYGLLSELASTFQTAEDFQLAAMDPAITDALINRLIAERDSKGRITQDVEQPEVAQLDPEMDDVAELMSWLYGHILSFFAKRTMAFAKPASEVNSALLPLAKLLGKLGTGSQD